MCSLSRDLCDGWTLTVLLFGFGHLCLDRGVLGSVWALFWYLPCPSYYFSCVCQCLLDAIDWEDHMFGKCDVYLLWVFCAEDHMVIWVLYTPLWLSERLKFRTLKCDVYLLWVFCAEDHMAIWVLYTPLWLSERLKFRTMGSHDCSIFSVCFKSM